MLQRPQISGSRAVILIRLMVGIVFLSEGIQKFLYPAEQGAGRFAKIGIPSPEFMGPFVGVAEIVCGTASGARCTRRAPISACGSGRYS